MPPPVLLLLQFLLAASAALGQNWKADPFIPPAIPLAVKSPYLQIWSQQRKLRGPLDGMELSWTGMIRVDDSDFFEWMGFYVNVVQKDLIVTSTKTIVTVACGSVDVTATFLNPIEPKDLVNQSIPFSFLSVEVSANDGQPHRVQLFTSISELLFFNENSELAWETTTDGTTTHRVWFKNQTQFTEVGHPVQYGSFVYSTKQADGSTYQVGTDILINGLFISTGALNNTVGPVPVVRGSHLVFAFAHDLGTVGASGATTPVVYTIGYERDPLVQFSNVPNINGTRHPYYLSRYDSILGMVGALLDDYPNILTRATNFDQKLTSDALAVTPQNSDYTEILTLSVCQLFGNIEFTTGWDDLAGQNDIMAFLWVRDGFTNTVDMVYSAWPAFLYTNPEIGRYLLEPVLAYQAANPVQGGYSIHDVGASPYLNVTGPSNATYPVEESGNQLIMALSYTQKTSDNSLIVKYKSLYEQFGTYLVQHGLYVGSQFSADSYAGELGNQTNLAIKSIVAIKAAAEIFRILGDDEKSRNFDNVAASYLEQWQGIALSSDGSHYTLSYGNNPSWGLLYNLYADRLLGFNMFPQSVYETQTKWYSGNINSFGIPLDSRSSDAKTDWQLWTAATLTDETLRAAMIALVKKYASSGLNDLPFPDMYDSETGKMDTFKNRAVVGGHFAPLLVPDVKKGDTGGSGGGGSDDGGINGGNNGGSTKSARPALPIALTLFVTLVHAL